MHVCHFAETAIESDYFKQIATGLTQNDIRVSLIELRSAIPPKWLTSLPQVRYLSLGADSKMQYPLAVWRLARYLKTEQVDLLHPHLYFAGLISIFATLLHKKTVVALMRHHTSVVRMLGSQIHIAADKWMAERADHVMTVSQAARDYMINVDGIRRDDIEIVYLGFDFEKMSPDPATRRRVRNEFGFTDNDLVIGYVGNFAKGKGHLQLVQAFTKIVEQIPNAKLFLVGRGMLDEIKVASANLSKDGIVFTGWRTDVADCLNAMDIFVQPSLSEAFSQVLIEAMGVGLPVIATDVGGAAEVIDHGVNGILIEPNDIDSIADSVMQLYLDPVTRKKIAASGQQSVKERFTIKKLVDRHLELYRRWITAR